jgi:hypothetical protein
LFRGPAPLFEGVWRNEPERWGEERFGETNPSDGGDEHFGETNLRSQNAILQIGR